MDSAARGNALRAVLLGCAVAAGVRREVIYVFLYDKKHFDEEYFVNQVLTAFNRMIPNSALIWD